jgi:uncharacterized membrane protein (DUF2068 family)
LFEAFKGAVVLVLGYGMLSFLGRDTEQLAERLLLRMHLDPANHYPQIFIRTMSEVTDTRLWLMAGFATLYALVRFVEAFGLWRERRWAEWFAAFSGGVYHPIEGYELVRHHTWVHFAALLVNLIIVAYMVWLLTETNRRRDAAGAPPAAGI